MKSRIWEKYGQLIRYFTFGILTTVSSIVAYFVVLFIGQTAFSIHEESRLLDIVRLIAQIFQWVVGVVVAFFTNKKWVFTSGAAKGKTATRKQFLMFTGSRFATFWVDTALTFLTIWLLRDALDYQSFTFIIEFTPDVWAKIVANIFVVISNYLISKYIVFNKVRNKLKQ